nr:PREDICTED: ADAMTS-like protein 5 [Latimeria chalumnae]|eukprot:XP_014346178.1 PREDICTED: ADAMTS-like protein 5 [Latimeria chalumnae]
MEDCPPGSRDFRQVQCSLYNNKPILGNWDRYQWVPFYGAPNVCDLNCLALGHNFYYTFGRVLDGTSCSQESEDICISGQCLKVGCDGILGSNAKTDICGVCAGWNDSCVFIRRIFQATFPPSGFFGYKNVTRIPAGATYIKVTDHSRNFLALMNGNSHYVINGNWAIDWPGVYDIAGTKVHYKRSADNYESFEASGPTVEDLHIMVLSQEQNPGIEYEFWLPNDRYTDYQGDYSPLRQPLSTVIEADSSVPHLPWIQTTSPPHTKMKPFTTNMPKTYKPTQKSFTAMKRPNVQQGHCRKCKKVKGRSHRIRQYCRSDFVFRAKIHGKKIVGLETRYDVLVKHTYKNNFPIVHREYIWVSGTCDCPEVLEKREYVLMARRHVNYEHTLNRILLEQNSYVKLWSPREDILLRDLNKHCT